MFFKLLKLAILSLVFSCGKQAPVDSIEKNRTLQSECTKLHLDKNLLTKTNVDSFFKCFGFDLAFENLYLELLRSDEKIAKFSNHFFSRDDYSEITDLYLSFSKNKESRHALSNILSSTRLETIIPKFLKSVKASKYFNKDQNKVFFNFLKEFANLIPRHLKKVQSSDFVIELKQLFDSFTPLSKNDIEIYSFLNMFFADFNKILKSTNFNSIKSLTTYLVENEVEIKRIMESFLNFEGGNKFTCFNDGGILSLDLFLELDERITDISHSSFEKFPIIFKDILTKFIFFKENCRKDPDIKMDLLNFEKSISLLREVTDTKAKFELFKLLLKSISKVDKDKAIKLIKLLSDESVFTIFKSLNTLFNKDDAGVLFSNLGSLDFIKISALFSSSVEVKENIIRDLVSYWDKLDENEKIDLLNSLFMILKDNGVTDFIFSLLTLYHDKVSYFEDEKNLIFTLLSFDNVKKDLSRFLKNDSLFNFLSKIKVKTLKPQVRPTIIVNSEENPSTYNDCDVFFLDLLQKEVPYDKLFRNLTDSCQDDNRFFTSKMMRASAYLNEAFNLDKEIDLYSNNLFSSEFVKIHTSLFLTNSLYVDGDYLKFLKNTAKLIQYLDEKKLLKPIIVSMSDSLKDAQFEDFTLMELDLSFLTSLHGNLKKDLLDYVISNRNNLIEFLYDTYKDKKNVTLYGKDNLGGLTLLERLEMALQEISFSNNYYGAYFINYVSISKNYHKAIKSIYSKLKLFSSTFSIFRRKNYVEQEDKNKVLNTVALFDSLFDIEKIKPEYANKSHDKTLKEILELFYENSKGDTKNLSMFNKPSFDMVKGHNIHALISASKNFLFSKASHILVTTLGSTKENFFKNKKIHTLLNHFLNLKPNELDRTEIISKLEYNNFLLFFINNLLKNVDDMELMSSLVNDKIVLDFISELSHMSDLVVVKNSEKLKKVLSLYLREIKRSDLVKPDVLYTMMKLLFTEHNGEIPLIKSLEILLNKEGETLSEFIQSLLKKSTISL